MRIAAGILAATTMIAGCGSASTGSPLARGDAARLRREVVAIRAAAAAHDPGRSRTAVATLRGEIDRLLRVHRLSAGDGRVMLTVLARADRRITAELHRSATSRTSTTRSTSSSTQSAPSTTPSTSSSTPSAPAVTSPAPTPSPPGPRPGHGHGQDHGHKGHDQGHGDGHGGDHGGG